jgi:RimJ/RimL family protein N-acetyltransferase
VLSSVVFETNTRSAAALGKQGYRHAGRMKWMDVKDGRYIDANVFDVKRDEWLAAREAWRATRKAVV